MRIGVNIDKALHTKAVLERTKLAIDSCIDSITASTDRKEQAEQLERYYTFRRVVESLLEITEESGPIEGSKFLAGKIEELKTLQLLTKNHESQQRKASQTAAIEALESLLITLRFAFDDAEKKELGGDS